MAFQSADEDQNKEKYDGIPMAWENLEHKCCPRCGDELSLFEHISMWKCFCGFKISVTKFNEIKYKIEDGDTFGDNSGYRFGRYHDEPPF